MWYVFLFFLNFDRLKKCYNINIFKKRWKQINESFYKLHEWFFIGFKKAIHGALQYNDAQNSLDIRMLVINKSSTLSII